MRKIAFIDTCFTGSILPLAKQFVENGWQVDLYELCANRINKKLEAMTFEEIPCPQGIGDIPEKYWNHMFSYISPDKFRFRYISTARPYKAVPVLREIVGCYRRRQLMKAVRYLDSEGYTAINFVSLYWDNDYAFLIENLKTRVLFSIHEVCNHFKPDFVHTPPLLSSVFKKGCPIIVFSDNSKKDISNYKDVRMENVHVIPFGRFESYLSMVRPSALNVGMDYFLFIGTFKPYKGLDLFAEAIKILNRTRPELRYVVAGSGQNATLDILQGIENVTIINKFIDNDDFAFLMHNAYSVVCPYKTASQSGIPQTSYVFGKPVIATNIGNFHEILGEGQFGILTEPESPQSLADAMLRMWEDKQLYSTMVDNIAHFDNIMPAYSWKRIYEMYQPLLF